jgi:hypothetical protein
MFKKVILMNHRLRPNPAIGALVDPDRAKKMLERLLHPDTNTGRRPSPPLPRPSENRSPEVERPIRKEPAAPVPKPAAAKPAPVAPAPVANPQAPVAAVKKANVPLDPALASDLFEAIRKMDKILVENLLGRGADPNGKFGNGTMFEICVEDLRDNANDDTIAIAELLLQYGARVTSQVFHSLEDRGSRYMERAFMKGWARYPEDSQKDCTASSRAREICRLCVEYRPDDIGDLVTGMDSFTDTDNALSFLYLSKSDADKLLSPPAAKLFVERAREATRGIDMIPM